VQYDDNLFIRRIKVADSCLQFTVCTSFTLQRCWGTICKTWALFYSHGKLRTLCYGSDKVTVYGHWSFLFLQLIGYRTGTLEPGKLTFDHVNFVNGHVEFSFQHPEMLPYTMMDLPVYPP
jgi:hypothetical protein